VNALAGKSGLEWFTLKTISAWGEIVKDVFMCKDIILYHQYIAPTFPPIKNKSISILK